MRMLHGLLFRSALVQKAQICLPADGDDAAKNAPIHDGNEGETKCRNCGPDLAAVDPASRDRVSHALCSLGKGGTRHEALHTEEVGIKNGGEEGLVDHNLGAMVSLRRAETEDTHPPLS